MGDKTKIDWCDASWNPVTGCLHGCEYCYARKIAKRFGGGIITGHDHLYILDKPMRCTDSYDYMRIAGISAGRILPYPYHFEPTFHRYKLEEPKHLKKPRTIFVCSMADLFGEWVPEEWILEAFDACRAAPQHRYLFLTKNPRRYIELAEKGMLPKEENFWYGSTATIPEMPFFYCKGVNVFLSVEPILAPFGNLGNQDSFVNWIIVGAETGNRKNKVVPQKAWIDELSEQCRRTGTPIFMKESLRGIMGEDFRQEYPWR